MTTDPLNLFALLDDLKEPIRRIPLAADVQQEVTNYLMKQKNGFSSDKRKMPFSGDYIADEDEVFFIQNFPLDKKISDAIEKPLSLRNLDLNKEANRIIALFTGKWSGRNKFAGFQGFDSRKVLSKGITILFSGDTYTKLRDAGLTLQDKFTALFENNELLFYSYHNTRHFIDLSNFYREATEQELRDFATNRYLFMEDKDDFVKNADSMIRKKVALLKRNKVLGKIQISDIQSAAKEYNITIETKDDKKIVVPSDRKELKNLLRFLDEDYFTTVLTKRKCLTNSKEFITT
jgi:hypothetical protein